MELSISKMGGEPQYVGTEGHHHGIMLNGGKEQKRKRELPLLRATLTKHVSLRPRWLNWVSRGTAINAGFDLGINFCQSILFA